MGPAEAETGCGALPRVESYFAWRNIVVIGPHERESRSFDVNVQGWSERSIWASGTGGDQAWMFADGSTSDPTILTARSDCSRSRMPVALEIMEFIDRDPETVLAGMGMASPQPVVASRQRVQELLVQHERADEHGRGQRAALCWLVGEGEQRPGSGRAWSGGEPDPWVVSAERDMAGARAARGDAPEWLAGVAEQLSAVLGVAGPLGPGHQDRAWLVRRVFGESEPPRHRDDETRLCHVRRGKRFRSWEVLAAEGVLGTVMPDGMRRWVATVDARPLSGRVYRSVLAAAHEIAIEGFGDGRARVRATPFADSR